MIKISKSLLENCKLCELSELNNFQGNLKELKEKEFHKLIASFVKFGFFAPFFVWIDKKGNRQLLDGHQRLFTLSKLKELALFGKIQKGKVEISDTKKQGFEAIIIPNQFPFVEIESSNIQDAKEKLLILNSQYGKITKEGFDEFLFDMDIEFVQDITSGLEGFFDNESLDSIEEIENNSDVIENSNKIILEYTEIEYNKVKKALESIDKSPEKAVYKLLNLK
jgi:hypothetical protein